MYILEKRKTKSNKLKRRIELRILVRYEDIYIYRIHILTSFNKKIVRSYNVRFNKRKGLIINRRREDVNRLVPNMII